MVTKKQLKPKGSLKVKTHLYIPEELSLRFKAYCALDRYTMSEKFEEILIKLLSENKKG